MARKRKAPTSQQTVEQKLKSVRKEEAEVKEEEESSDEETPEQSSSSEEEESESESESKSEDEDEEEESSSEEEADDEASKGETLRELLEPFGKSQIIDLLKEAVAKDPKLLPKIMQKADSDPTHRKIFVFGLGYDTTTEHLVEAFKPFGEIEESKLITDKNTGRAKGYALVMFKTRASAKKALKVPQKRIGSRTVSCQLAAIGRSAGVVEADGGNRKMYVANVAPHVSPEKLRAYFGSFGEIEEGPLGMDPATNKFKGFAVITYKSPEGFQKAMEEPIKVFENCQLQCKKFVDNCANNSPRQNRASNVNPSVTDVGYSSMEMNTTGIFGANLNENGLLMAQNPGIGLAGNALLAAGFNPASLAAGYNPASLAAGYNPAGLAAGYNAAGLAAGYNPAGLAAGYNPAGLAAGYNPASGLGASMGGMSGNYGINSIIPAVVGNLGSHEARNGLGTFQNAQAGLPPVATAAVGTSTTATKVPTSSVLASPTFPSYFRR